MLDLTLKQYYDSIDGYMKGFTPITKDHFLDGADATQVLTLKEQILMFIKTPIMLRRYLTRYGWKFKGHLWFLRGMLYAYMYRPKEGTIWN